MSDYYGDIRLEDTIDIKFTTRQISGAPSTLSSSPVISAYPGNSTTQLTAGITLTVDFDSVTGYNNVRVAATNANGYAAATNYDLAITTGTVNSVSVVGESVGAFSIENRSALMPTTVARKLDVSAGGEAGVDWANIGSPTTTVNLSGTSTLALEPTTAGRKLDVTTTGEAGIDWANIGAPTTTVNLSGTTVKTATDVETDTQDIQSRLPAALVSGRMDSNMQAAATGVITAAVIADAAIDRATFAADTGLQTVRSNTAQAGAGTTITLDASASAVDDFYANEMIFLTGGTGVGQARVITAYNGTTKVATVATWATNPDNTTTFAILPFGAIPGATAPTAAQVATAVWQDTTAGDFTTAGSIGKSLFTSGAVPGAAGGLFLAGSNAATTIAGLTTGALACTTITASGAVAFQSTFAVTGTTTLAAVTTSGTVTLNALTVSNATTLTGAVSLGSTLGVTGTATFAAVTTTGTVTMNALTVSNATTLTGAVSATNASNDVRGVLLQKTICAAMDELGSDPGATPTGAQALSLLYMGLRNKRDTTASEDTICNNAGSVILTATLSDDTVTFEKSKYA